MKTIVNMTATEILHNKGVQFPYSRSPRDFNLVLIAMEEYASHQSASLVEENERLKEALALICLHFPKSVMIDQMGEDFEQVSVLLSPKEETK